MRLKHGHARKGAQTPTFVIWYAMIKRCTMPRNKDFHSYGGRGIKVCERWMEYKNFHDDMGDRPEGLSIDRINNDGNYEPGNCRWVSRQEQSWNTRRNRRITFNGSTKCISQWSTETGISSCAIYQRLDAGWTVEKALTQPSARKAIALCEQAGAA